MTFFFSRWKNLDGERGNKGRGSYVITMYD